MQQAHQLAGTIMEQSRNEILERTKRREHAEMGERICISGKNTHSPSIIESQVMNAMPDQCFLNTIVLSDCTSHCTHNKSLHVYADISEDSQASIPDIKTIISSHVKTNHKETCSEFVVFSGSIKKYKDSSGEYMRFKLRDDFLSGRLNESVLYHWKSYDCDTDSIFEDTDETCQCCYGTPQTKPLSTKSFNVLWEWYIETPLVCQILFEIFINQRSLKRADETKQFLKKKYTRLYMQYDSFLNILNKRYCGILQDKSTQELSMNYHSLSAVFNLTSAGGLTQSLTTAEQKLKDMANSENTYFNTYLKKYALTYETSAGESTEKVCVRDCVLVLMMDNLVRLKKHADPDPGESRSMQICTLPITIKGIPKDALECVNWHDADCEACVDIICKCKQDKVLNSSDVDNLLIHLTTKQQSGFNDFKKLVTFGYSDIWKAVLKGNLTFG
ncbi:hypothetical protein DPMN_094294 [Dreissena polymorpha]|uniref:Uncharacterized protein n=2 Tax=Dreissena polymorpha TaxID=45954 RepID=A0A9D4L5V4_DREPO|nr:hypothetical protein DPMN_094294 [Dreissena polymorpha]